VRDDTKGGLRDRPFKRVADLLAQTRRRAWGRDQRWCQPASDWRTTCNRWQIYCFRLFKSAHDGPCERAMDIR